MVKVGALALPWQDRLGGHDGAHPRGGNCCTMNDLNRLGFLDRACAVRSVGKNPHGVVKEGAFLMMRAVYTDSVKVALRGVLVRRVGGGRVGTQRVAKGARNVGGRASRKLQFGGRPPKRFL